jgi:hypothetical protein
MLQGGRSCHSNNRATARNASAAVIQTRGRIVTDLQRAGGNSAVRQRLADPQQTPTVSTACRPSEATPTTSIPVTASSIERSNTRDSAESSASTTRRSGTSAVVTAVRTEHSRSLPSASHRTAHTAAHHGNRESAAGNPKQAEA